MHYITGSHGFIGKKLCSVLSDAVSGSRKGGSGKAEHIIDLASYGNLAHQTDIKEIYKENVVRVMELLVNVKDYKSLILTSTSALQLQNHTPYIRAKGDMEQMALAFYRATEAPICIIRPASITGVGEQNEHLIPKLIDSCLNGKEIPFVEEPMHDYIDVEDVVSAILFIEQNIEKFVGRVINISSSIGYANRKVKELVEKVTGNKANVHIISSLRSYDSDNWIVNNTELLYMGWKPKKTLEQSICEMISKAKSLK